MSEDNKSRKRPLVEETAARLREQILAREPGARLGSLNEVAQLLGVGIVTVQQAARVLEHEGLLAVRRGPGGGYYGDRPDEAALERAFATYMHLHGFDYHDSLEVMSLFDCEMIPAAARADDGEQRDALRELHGRIEQCDTADERIRFERELREVLFKLVERPLLELLCRITTQLHGVQSRPLLFSDAEGVRAWKDGRRRILEAILQRDDELARFESERYRREVLARVTRLRENDSSQARRSTPPRQ